jgi:cytosine/adenosine deaminase-related metal-dependent hydrolase
MSYEIDILLKDVHVVDPVNHINGINDIAVADGKIINIAKSISPKLAEDVYHLEGYVAVPGIIDSHVHASSLTNGVCAHKMLAAAGVTTALEMAGPVDSVWEIMNKKGAGLNMACIHAVAPGFSVKNDRPSLKELRKLFKAVTSKGAIGFKILGGHFPLTPDATVLCTEVAKENNGYCAFHVGTTETQSDIKGFFEAVELSAGKNVHLAHINSYCRGADASSLIEAIEASKVLEENSNIFSESYLSPMNGTSGKIINDKPASNATAMWLKKFGVMPNHDGMKKAIKNGIAKIIVEEEGEMILQGGPNAIQTWENKGTDTLVSFDINPADSRFALATAKRNDGQFVVDCISTDGGGIPRNEIIEKGLALVDFQALSLNEFVLKTSTNPADMLGLKNKGRLGIGNDADITIIDKFKNKPFMSIAVGRVIMHNGKVIGKKGTALVFEEGKKYAEDVGLTAQVINPSNFFKRSKY